MKQIATKANTVDTLDANGFNSFMEELENAVLMSGQTLDTAAESTPDPDTEQLGQSIVRAAQTSVAYADSGTANNYVLTRRGGTWHQPEEYLDGMTITFYPSVSNTGATSINVSSLGARNVFRADGNVLEAGDILANTTVIVEYQASNDRFILVFSEGFMRNVIGDSNVAGNFVTIDTAQTVTGLKTFGANPIIASGAPQLNLLETDAPASHGRTVLSRNDNIFRIRTEQADGTGVEDLYRVTQDASGATQHSWLIAGTVRVFLDNDSLDLTVGTLALGDGTAGGDTLVNFRDNANVAARSFGWDNSLGAFVYENVNGEMLVVGGLGSGQTWQDVAGSRVIGTAYRNTTGRPIQVQVTASDDIFLQLSTDNSTWHSIARSDTAGDIGGATVSLIVPDDIYYRVTGADSILEWWELRT